MKIFSSNKWEHSNCIIIFTISCLRLVISGKTWKLNQNQFSTWQTTLNNHSSPHTHRVKWDKDKPQITCKWSSDFPKYKLYLERDHTSTGGLKDVSNLSSPTLKYRRLERQFWFWSFVVKWLWRIKSLAYKMNHEPKCQYEVQEGWLSDWWRGWIPNSCAFCEVLLRWALHNKKPLHDGIPWNFSGSEALLLRRYYELQDKLVEQAIRRQD